MTYENALFGMLILIAALVLCASPASADPSRTAYEDDGMMTYNGARTFIIGSYFVPPTETAHADMAKIGFNLIHAGLDTAELDKAQAAGLMTWVSVGAIEPEDRDASIQRITQAVTTVKDHPALALIETIDEPAWSWLKAEQRVPADILVETYPLIKNADPNHLLYLNHAPTNLVKTLQAYNNGTDAVAMDIYPVNPGGLKSMYALFADGFQGDLNNEHISQVGKYVDKMRKVTGPNRPLFMVLQGFAWEMLTEPEFRREEKILYPSYAQTRFMAFQSIIKGANGIIYWGMQTMPQPSQPWTDLTRVVREVADLHPVLSQRAAAVELAFDYQEMGYSLDDGVQARVIDHADKRYVFTCNADKNPCKAIVTGMGEWTTCTVLNEEGRTLPIEAGAITDTWTRFGVHIYEFAK